MSSDGVSMIERLCRAITAANRLAFGLSAAVMLGVAPLLLVQVVSRYALGNPAAWAGETATLLFGPHFLMAGPYLLHLRQHVGVDILTQRLSPRGRDLLDLVLMPVVIGFALTLAHVSLPLAVTSWELRETSFSSWNPPIWWTKFFLPAAMLMLALQALAEMAMAALRLRRGGACA